MRNEQHRLLVARKPIQFCALTVEQANRLKAIPTVGMCSRSIIVPDMHCEIVVMVMVQHQFVCSGHVKRVVSGNPQACS